MSERTRKTEAIFHAASELTTAEERKSYLLGVCGGDSDLQREVESLLRAMPVGEELFRPCERPGARTGGGLPGPQCEDAGSVIGRYKLLEKIGEGGMGVVYMAEQEEPVRRKVALKIIKLGMDTRQVVSRFDAERQALAMMDHPNMARVLDAGATDAGRPFFVMELVVGVPITKFCETQKLSVEERLRLFSSVCHAIQSAHQKGIIHRDIKPSNVLVTMHNGAPHPMVIDFGVAKAVDQKLTEKTLFTNFATLIGTPAYMSPEQAEMSKLDVDTRSDIYSLGVLLYELLTGTPPFSDERLRSVAYSEMQRIIAEEEPERPSTRLRKRLPPKSQIANRKSQIVNRKSQIDSDLDWIVMKCLEKDRNRRYETADGLAADLKRHLENEPVVARPPGAFYRLQKFARRNRFKFAAATVALVAVIGGLAVSTWQAVRATRAEGEALAVKEFLIEQLLAANLYMETANDPSRRQLLERVAEAAGTRFANQPLIEAEVRMAVAEAFYGLDDGAHAALEQFQRALAIRRRLLGPTHSDTFWTIACTAQAHQELGHSSEAEKVLAEALEWVDAKGQPQSVGEAEVLQTQGSFLINSGRPAEAIPYLDRAMEVSERSADHKTWRFQNKLQWRIKAHLMAGRTNEADALSLDGIRQAEDHFGSDHPVTAKFYAHRAGVLFKAGRSPQEVVKLSGKVVPVFRRSLGIDHTETLHAEFNLARGLELAGELESALKVYSGLYERVSAKLPSDWARKQMHLMGRFFANQGRVELARAVREPLCKSYETNAPANESDFRIFLQAAATTTDWPAAADLCGQYVELFPNGRDVCLDMARSIVQERRADEAKTLYDLLRQTFPGGAPKRAEDMELLIEATAASLGWAAAADLCRKHFDLFSESLLLWLNKAWVFRYVGDEESYHRVVREVLALSANDLIPEDQHTPIEIAALGSYPFGDDQVNRLDEMMHSLDAAMPGHSTELQIYGYRAIGLMQFRLGRFERCLAVLDQAAARQESPEAYPLFIRSMCLHRLGRTDEARASFSEAESLMPPLLKEDIAEPHRFLPPWAVYQQIVMHREARALLGIE